MTRREFTKLPAFGAAGATALAAQAQQPSRQPRTGPPNIIFFMADQMTPLMTGPYRHKAAHTPHLHSLAPGRARA